MREKLASKKKKGEKKGEKGTEKETDKGNEFKSGKFFKNLGEISKQDKEKKDLKRAAKISGKS